MGFDLYPKGVLWIGVIGIIVFCQLYPLDGASPLDVDFFRGDETKYSVLLISKDDERVI